jgi:hypothetical protein
MKKQITKKLQLSKETLRDLSERDLQGAVGGATARCTPTGLSDCFACPTETCSDGSCQTWTCC